MNILNNYKNIRKKPNVWGFTYHNLILFLIIEIISSLMFLFGFSVVKLVIFVVVLAVNYLVCMYLLSGNIFNDLLSEKFPDEINDLTKNG